MRDLGRGSGGVEGAGGRGGEEGLEGTLEFESVMSLGFVQASEVGEIAGAIAMHLR